MLRLLGQFDPGSTVLVLDTHRSTYPDHEARRPHEGAEVIETATADETGSMTFTAEVLRTKRYLSRSWVQGNLWVRGVKDGIPVEQRAVRFDDTQQQAPIQPDRPWTPRVPRRTSTSGGAS